MGIHPLPQDTGHQLEDLPGCCQSPFLEFSPTCIPSPLSVPLTGGLRAPASLSLQPPEAHWVLPGGKRGGGVRPPCLPWRMRGCLTPHPPPSRRQRQPERAGCCVRAGRGVEERTESLLVSRPHLSRGLSVGLPPRTSLRLHMRLCSVSLKDC